MNVLIKLPLTGYRPGSSANIANYVLYLLQIFFSKQWLWFSCLSGRFQHERSTVRIQSMAKIYPEQECSLNCWKGENKERERPSKADLIYNNPPRYFHLNKWNNCHTLVWCRFVSWLDLSMTRHILTWCNNTTARNCGTLIGFMIEQILESIVLQNRLSRYLVLPSLLRFIP